MSYQEVVWYTVSQDLWSLDLLLPEDYDPTGATITGTIKWQDGRMQAQSLPLTSGNGRLTLVSAEGVNTLQVRVAGADNVVVPEGRLSDLEIFSTKAGSRTLLKDMPVEVVVDGTVPDNQTEPVAVNEAAVEAITDILGAKADKTVEIAADGLATGGGTLSASRTITVPAANQAEHEAGAISNKAATPLGVAQHVAAKRGAVSGLMPLDADGYGISATPPATLSGEETATMEALRAQAEPSFAQAGAAADRTTTDDTTEINAKIEAMRQSIDNRDIFVDAPSGRAKESRVNSSIDASGISGIYGAGIRDQFFYSRATGKHGLDLSRSRRNLLRNVGVYGHSTSTPLTGLLMARPSSGNISSGHILDPFFAAGTFDWASAFAYASEVFNGQMILANAKRDRDAYCYINQGDDVFRTPTSDFGALATGRHSNIEHYLPKLECRRFANYGAGTIVSISNTNPAVVTVSGSTPPEDSEIYISAPDSSGMVEVIDRVYKANNVNAGAKTFELQTLAGVDVDATGYGTYTSGGTSGYVTGPAVGLADLSALEALQAYLVVYGAPAIDGKWSDTSGPQPHWRDVSFPRLHVEGVPSSIINFRGIPADETFIWDDGGLTMHNCHANDSVFSADDAGDDAVIEMRRLKIRITGYDGTTTPTNRIFDDPSRYRLYDCEFVVPSEEDIPDLALFDDVSGTNFKVAV